MANRIFIAIACALAASCGGGDSGAPASSSPPAAPPVLALVAGSVGSPPAADVDATGPAARFNDAGPIAADNEGTLYVAEGLQIAATHAVRKVARDGAVTTLYRTEPANLLVSLVGIGVDRSRNAYFAYWPYCGLRCQRAPPELRKVDASGSMTTLPVNASNATAGPFSASALAADADGNVYLGEESGVVRKVAADGTMTTLFEPAGVTSSVAGIAIDDEGNVYTTHLDAAGTIRRITPSGQVSLIAQGYGTPAGITVDEGHNLYVAHPVAHVVRKITPGGVVSTIAGVEGNRGFAAGPLPGLLDAPLGVAASGNDLYITMATAVAVIRNRP